MSEFICIQVGQCGNQIGNIFWPQILDEYGLLTSKKVSQMRVKESENKNLRDAFHSFFHIPDNIKNFSFQNIADCNTAQIKARAILIDMEDSVVSRFQRGPLKFLFDPSYIVKNYLGSGNNWAIGYYTHGRTYQDEIQNVIRKVTETCDSLHGFLLMHSLGGGTGSGLGTAVLNFLQDDFPNVNKFVSSVYPSDISDVVITPYNVLLGTRELIEQATCVFPVDNDALLDICKLFKNSNTDQLNYGISWKPFQDMNNIIVNMLLHLTSGARFPGHLNTDMNDLITNLVPYPQLHYIFSSVSPIVMDSASVFRNNRLQDELFINVWSRSHQLIKLDPLHLNASIIGMEYIARGNCSIESVESNIRRFQKNKKFTAWSNESIKVGLCSIPPTHCSSSLLCLSNSTSMRFMLERRLNQFNQLYKRKAHLHHYLQIEGFDLEHFKVAQESIQKLCDRYKEVESEKDINTVRLKMT